MRLFILLLYCMFSVLQTQSQFSGRVLSSDNNLPVAFANVYISNSLIGTITNEKGAFSIDHIPELRFDLIISCIGYETQKLSLEKNKIPPSLTILLKPKVIELQEVIVEPYEKDGWEKWGQTFSINFIGTSAFASDCVFKNKEALKFRYNKKENIITVTADERLVFENQALGYLLKYDLTKFEYNYKIRVFEYEGFPFFEEMESDKKRKQNRWMENRRQAYYGSLTHFMRSLYRNRLIQEGFEVRTLIPVLDLERERERVKKIYWAIQPGKKNKQGYTIPFDLDSMKIPNEDSVEYYQKLIDHKGSEPVVLHKLLTGDSIAFASDSITCYLEFAGHLNVIYKPRKNPAEYARFVPKEQMYGSVTSELYRTSNLPIRVFANGSFYNGKHLMTSGYWSWWEKICNRLPDDYKPDGPVK